MTRPWGVDDEMMTIGLSGNGWYRLGFRPRETAGLPSLSPPPAPARRWTVVSATCLPKQAKRAPVSRGKGGKT
jgi:hypothetical protein